jgi:hypothetical protein
MLHVSALDYTILAIYFLVGLGIGAVARRSITMRTLFHHHQPKQPSNRK